MNRWMGSLVAVLALACAGQRAESGGTARSDDSMSESERQAASSPQSGGAEDPAADEQAASSRPTEGSGKTPHPQVTDPQDPSYAGTEGTTQPESPGLGGRPAVAGQREGQASAGAAAGTGAASASARAGETRNLNEVYGMVNDVSGDELEIEPEYGDPIKVKLNDQTMYGAVAGDSTGSGTGMADAAALSEGDEVRVAFDESSGDKVAVTVKTGDEATPVEGASSSSSMRR